MPGISARRGGVQLSARLRDRVLWIRGAGTEADGVFSGEFSRDFSAASCI